MNSMVKGYMIEQTGLFILGNPEIKERVPSAILDQIARNATTVKPTEWQPRDELVTLFRAIAESQPDEKRASETLVKCGEAIGAYAIGTFLKLLLKMLTPRMFGRKFPDLWRRDHQGGIINVESVDDHRFVMWIKDIEGFDHISQCGMGWCAVGFRAMGLKGLQVECGPWSMSQPGAKDVCFIATWT